MTAKTKKRIRLIGIHALSIGGFVAILFVLSLFDIPFCPLKLFFDVGCPFCGMTRAHMAALRLDFAAAFSYHPLFFMGIPFLWILFHDFLFKKSKVAKITYIILESTMLASLIITYIVRVVIYGFDFM